MSKRKQNHDMDVDGDSSDEEVRSSQPSIPVPPTIVDVNFDFYNVNSDNDYLAINRLLIQLFGYDAESLQTGPLTDVITKAAEKNGVGSTIKTDDEEGSDPYAFLTVVGCHNNSGLKILIDYVLSKTKADQGFHGTLLSLLQDPKCNIGLILGERLINIPVQVMPAMYRMLLEEIHGAIGDGQPYRFTHYLFISRVYRLTPEEEEAIAAVQRNSKRYKSTGNSQMGRSKDGVYGFHPEDEEIIQHATHAITYSFTNAPPRDAESVGLDKFKALVERIGVTYAVAESSKGP
ncbi:p21-C-terminal region-binding protein-domain-containing protein [Melanogaster broomeanus]|nr:p21-C-terminal region-binding protein-domain-containing protein [Melanogaster broomeanus]